MRITVLKPSKGKVTTTWLEPEEVVSLVRSDKYSREIGEFRGLYPLMKGEKVELPRVNKALPALCFGAELERTEGNDFVHLNGYRPVIAKENNLLAGEEITIPHLGSFHVGVKSDSVESPEEFDPQRHIHDLHIKFRPFSRRDPVTWKLTRPILDEAKVVVVEQK